MKILLTGDRPSGPLHLGHLVGSLENRVKLQELYNSFILVADTQALTDNYHQPDLVKEHVLDLVADYLAVGLDPEKCNICLQSALPELLELTQILSNLTNFEELKHNPTLKTELAQKKINNLSFISYPVSQAADILGFNADVVPVGGDQEPILQLTNKLARKFNEMYKVELLKRIEGVYSETPRLKGVDGSSKMSKSLNNAIFLKDSLKEIKKKVNAMYTDPLHVKISDPGHIEGNVVFYYLDIFDEDKLGLEELKIAYQKGGISDGATKERLVRVLEAKIGPIRAKREEIRAKPEYLKAVLKQGTEAARKQVQSKIEEMRKILFLNL